MRCALLGFAAAGMFTVPATAGAATVSITTPLPVPQDSTVTLSFIAGEGEANRLTFTVSPRPKKPYLNNFNFTDPGANVHAGTGCKQVDAHTASCPEQDTLFFFPPVVRLRDGNDRLDAETDVVAHGGRGNDVLVGRTGWDALDGGGGTDRLIGGDGPDVLTDGDRDGAAPGGAPNKDILSGGPGSDTLSYAQRTRAVNVNLENGAPPGEAGEDDAASGFENATGGSGDDHLVGNDDANVLTGKAGNDHLLGRGGGFGSRYDQLYGGRGRDRLEGGDGNDWLHPGAGRDRFSCALGFDQIFDPRADEVIGRCERMSFSVNFGDGDTSVVFAPRPEIHRRYLDYGVIPCPENTEGTPMPCDGELELRKASGKRRLLGRGHVVGNDESFEEGTPDPAVLVRLTKRGRRLIHRRRGVLTTASLRGVNLPDVAWTTRIRP